MKRNGWKSFAVALAVLFAPNLGRAAALPKPESLKARFFSGLPGTDNVSVPPAATPMPVKAAAPAPAAASSRVQPDLSYTPGRLCTPSDPDFQEYRYAERIPYCRRNVTQQMKQEVAAHYGIPQNQWSNYEFDHLIPLAIGGDSHVDNVWPQPRGSNGSDGKDVLEYQLYLEMKAGTITQAEAIRQIYAWFAAALASGLVMPPHP